MLWESYGDRSKFDTSASQSLFGGKLSQMQVDGMEGVFHAFATHGDGEDTTLAYALATAFHETGRQMSPVRETFATSDDQAIRRLDAWAKKKGRTKNIYWRPQPPYGEAYFGRGHVQLTLKSNYERSSGDAGVDLEKNPNAMLDPEISARVLIKGLIDGRWNGQGHGIRYYLDPVAYTHLDVYKRQPGLCPRYREGHARTAQGGHTW